MPESRLARARESGLPIGYQFGDAAPPRVHKFSDPDWMEYWESHYIQPVREMFADPVKYAAYRAAVDEALKSPAEVARAADVQRMMDSLPPVDFSWR